MNLEHNFNIVNRDNLALHLDKKTKENFMQSLTNHIENLRKGLPQENIVMKESASIDRLEGNIAVCELSSGNMLDIPTENFGFPVSEGDILSLDIIYKEGLVEKIVVNGKDEEEKQRRLDLINEKMNQIKNK